MLWRRLLEEDAAQSNALFRYCIILSTGEIRESRAADSDVDDDQSAESVDSLSEHVLLLGLETSATHTLEPTIEYLNINEDDVRRNAKANRSKAVDLWYHT